MKPLLTRITGPAVMPVTREFVKFHLYIDTDHDDELVDSYIEAAVDRLDGPHGLLNRALITQTWMAQFPRFEPEMRIPLPRCQSVSSITYWGTDGASHAVPLQDYRVTGLGTDHARIRPVTSWPATADMADAVSIIFVSGFGDDPEDVPASIRHAVMEMVSSAYENRSTVDADLNFAALPHSATRAVTDWTCWNP